MLFHVFSVNHPAFGVSQGNPPAFQAKKAAEDQATKLATEEAQEEAKEGALSKGFLSMAVVAICQRELENTTSLQITGHYFGNLSVGGY